MPVTTQRSAALQPAAGAPATRRRRRTRLVLLHLCIIALGVVLAVWAYRHFQPVPFTHPGFDPAAVAGEPQVDEEYAVRLCGVPANDGQNVSLFLTNPAENGVWFRAEVVDGDGTVLASTGVLRQGEYLPSVALSRPLTQRETPVTVRIVAYEPDTWRSRGNVNLNLTLYLDFS